MEKGSRVVEKREITGIHDISGTIYREVGPSFRKVLGTDTELDASGIRRIWHRGARKTELLTWETEDGSIVRQELTFQNLLIETNQTGIVRTGRIPEEGNSSQSHAVQFTPTPDPGVLSKCAMLLADMKQRDAYLHQLLETLNITLETTGHAPVNVMYAGPHNHDRLYHDSLVKAPVPSSSYSEEAASPDVGPRSHGYLLQIALGFIAATGLLIFLAR